MDYLADCLARECTSLSYDLRLLWGCWMAELKIFLVFSKSKYFWLLLTHTLLAFILTVICIAPWVLGFVCRISGWYHFLDFLERKFPIRKWFSERM